MKSLAKTPLKLAALIVFVVLGVNATAKAQNPRISTAQLDALASKATETVDLNLDEGLMQLAAKAFSGSDPDEMKVKELVNHLKGIYVKSFEFATEGQYSATDLESVRSQLRNSAWKKIFSASSKKEGSVEIYLMQSGAEITGLALLASDPKEITVVNIVGPVDLQKLSELEGHFGVPVLDIDLANPKRKNQDREE
ncbi:MAG TPA: DUF4252 domain-containing protein [Pyrinomonadaceae bacterium]|jgi:hypothetical protein|nr:DUF4252 domain-containing protein [Pyrinomonadaceae bacterium]